MDLPIRQLDHPKEAITVSKKTLGHTSDDFLNQFVSVLLSKTLLTLTKIRHTILKFGKSEYS